jgi:hypothetical protein
MKQRLRLFYFGAIKKSCTVIKKGLVFNRALQKALDSVGGDWSYKNREYRIVQVLHSELAPMVLTSWLSIDDGYIYGRKPQPLDKRNQHPINTACLLGVL